jgi:hypothetical protein
MATQIVNAVSIRKESLLEPTGVLKASFSRTDAKKMLVTNVSSYPRVSRQIFAAKFKDFWLREEASQLS